MSLTKAVKGSNAPDQSGDNAKTSGSLGMVGFTDVSYPSQMPAKSNSDLTSLDNPPGLGNDGTNIDSYKDQPEDVSAKKGGK